KFFRDTADEIDRLPGHTFGNTRRHDRDIEDMIAMYIFGDGEGSHFTVRIARNDDRYLLLEINRLLQDKIIAGPRFPDVIKIARHDRLLPLAIVTEGSRL